MFTKTFLFANPLQDALKELGKGDLPKPKKDLEKNALARLNKAMVR